jgi:hypothetical protein
MRRPGSTPRIVLDMKLRTKVTLSVVALGAAGLWMASSVGLARLVGSSWEPSKAEQNRLHAAAFSAERGDYYMIASNDYYPSLKLGLGVQVNRQGIHFSTRERHPATGEWFSEDTFQSTAFVPYSMASVSGNVFFAIGKSGGDDVLEMWTVRPATGAYVASRPLSLASPIGTPLVTPALTIQILGGAYLPPSQRGVPLVTRRAVYQGSDLGGFRAAVADPDGRFILAIGETNPGLYRINTAGGSVELVLDALTLPYLADAMHIRAIRDATLGRVYVIRAFGLFNGIMAVLAFDNDNDGVIDYTSILDEAGFANSALMDPPTEDFHNY